MIVDFLLTSIVTESIKQRYCIKFCQKLGNNQTETIQKIQQAFGDEALSQTQMKEWFNCFKNGQMSVESETRSGRPSTSRNKVFEKVHQIVMEDYCLTLREIIKVELRRGSVHSILIEDLCMQRVAEFILKLLTEHDNAPAHSTHVIKGFLAKNNMALV